MPQHLGHLFCWGHVSFISLVQDGSVEIGEERLLSYSSCGIRAIKCEGIESVSCNLGVNPPPLNKSSRMQHDRGV